MKPLKIIIKVFIKPLSSSICSAILKIIMRDGRQFQRRQSCPLYCQRILYKNKAIANPDAHDVPKRIISNDLSTPAVSVGYLSA